MNLIDVDGLSKEYKINVKQPGLGGAIKNLFHREYMIKTALDQVSFKMEEGDSLACLGENGAGKSTLTKILVGVLHPTKGVVSVCGDNPFLKRESYMRNIGVMFGQKTNLWWEIPIIESFNAMQVLYKIEKQQYKQMLDICVEMLKLQELLNIPARKLSLGQRMKADLTLTLLHQPKLLLLDEPTIGLDINSKSVIRDFIRTINKEKQISIFLTSHDLEDIEQICEKTIILSSGKKIFDGTIEQLKHDFMPNKKITIKGKRTRDLQLPNDIKVEELHDDLTHIYYDYKKYSVDELLNTLFSYYEFEDISVSEVSIADTVKVIYSHEEGKSHEILS